MTKTKVVDTCNLTVIDRSKLIDGDAIEIVGDVEDLMANRRPNGLLLSNDLNENGPWLYLRNQINDF